MSSDPKRGPIHERSPKPRRIPRDEYEARSAPLRIDLLNAQFDLREAKYAAIVLLTGDDRQACEEVFDALHEWMDGRYLNAEVFLQPLPEERARPPYWRYWRALPPHGKIGIFFGAWAYDALSSRVVGRASRERFGAALESARRIERTLAIDGTLLIKLWCHSPKKLLKERVERVSAKRQSWRVAKRDRAVYRHHDRLVRAGDELIERTEAPHASWHVIECSQERSRNLQIMHAIRDALQGRLAQPEPAPPSADPLEPQPRGAAPRLDELDLGAELSRESYRKQLSRWQRRLAELSLEAVDQGVSTVLVFEGWDAAGKGGTIRRISSAISAQYLRTIPIAAPSDEEAARHYLWRFWRHIPRAGHMTIFDRSWYGRVLVERIEALTPEFRWREAYGEIIEFEKQFADCGMLVQKFWLHISPDEQLRRFRDREQTPYKKYKITDEDYRNRERWDEYARAAQEMVTHTHADGAPWFLIPANDKRFARVSVLRTLCGGLERQLARTR